MMLHLHPMPITGSAILDMAQESVQLIQKHLRLTMVSPIYSSLLLTAPGRVTVRHSWEHLNV